MFNGLSRRPVLSAQERLPEHRAEVQSFLRCYRCYSSGVNPVMVPQGMMPQIVGVYAGFNIWHEPTQGYYWVDGFEPAFPSLDAARAYAATQVPPFIGPEGLQLIPVVIGLGILAALVTK